MATQADLSNAVSTLNTAIASGDSATQLALTDAVTSLTEAIAAGDGNPSGSV